MTGKVCIILVNFYGHNDTIECIESIFKSTNQNFQLIVIDNSIENSSLNIVESYLMGETKYEFNTLQQAFVYPLEKKPINFRTIVKRDFELLTELQEEKVLLVRSESNLGFAGGNNIGLKYFLKFEHFEFVWLLNNDTVVRPDTLMNLVQFGIESNSSIGVIGSKLFNYYQPTVLQAVGGRYYKWFGKINEIGAGQIDSGQWDMTEFDVDYVIGASMFVKKKFVERVGLMEENYFLYFEELDWAIRGKRKGWGLGFCHESRVYHKMGSSINQGKKNENSELSDFYSSRNKILIALNFFPYTLITLYPAFLRFIINRVRIRQYSRIYMLLKILINPKRHYKFTRE